MSLSQPPTISSTSLAHQHQACCSPHWSLWDYPHPRAMSGWTEPPWPMDVPWFQVPGAAQLLITGCSKDNSRMLSSVSYGLPRWDFSLPLSSLPGECLSQNTCNYIWGLWWLRACPEDRPAYLSSALPSGKGQGTVWLTLCLTDRLLLGHTEIASGLLSYLEVKLALCY